MNIPKEAKNSNSYDVIIIGAGIIGASIAFYLSSFKLKVLLIEKNSYAGLLTTTGNSGILHCGFDANPNESKAKFNVEGKKLWEKWFEFLDFPRQKTPSLVIAFDEEEEEICQKLLQRGFTNKVDSKYLYYRDSKGVKEFENSQEKSFGIDYEKIKGALICENSWVIDPVLATRTLLGAAIKNQIEYLRDCEVVGLKVSQEDSNLLEVVTPKETFLTKKVINAAGANVGKIAESLGDFSIKIKSRRGQYKVVESQILTTEKSAILFGVPSKFGKGVLVAPRLDQRFIIGPTAQEGIDFQDAALVDIQLNEDLERLGKLLCPQIETQRAVGFFAGTRPINVDGGDFRIEVSKVNPNLINVGAIQSPGLTAAPAIAEFVAHKLLELTLIKKENFDPLYKLVW